MPLEIKQAGDPVLRRKARELSAEEIRGGGVQQLIEAMRETVRAAPGVGLAAPQIGLDFQLAVIEDTAEYIAGLPAGQAIERRREPVPFHVLINPTLSFDGGEWVEFFEGCLSLPGFAAVVPRALQVRVHCLDHNAEPLVIQAAGWYARILQHEIDHLNGTLYIDRMRPRSFSNRENLERYWKHKPAAEVLEELTLNTP